MRNDRTRTAPKAGIVNERVAPRQAKGAMKGAKDFARVSDVVLTIVFAVLAFRAWPETGLWFWFCVASSVFCAVAVYRSPIDMMWGAATGRLYGQRNG